MDIYPDGFLWVLVSRGFIMALLYLVDSFIGTYRYWISIDMVVATAGLWNVDPHHFNADSDLDPSFNFNSDPNPLFHFNGDPDLAPN